MPWKQAWLERGIMNKFMFILSGENLHIMGMQEVVCHCLKFDDAYGPAWHCVVGKDFGCCITHLSGSFIFFRVEMMEFLIFKDGRDFSESKEEAIGVLQQFQKSDT
ncbi:dynein light chain 1, cytoplasmic-like isoform X3 [Populus nigra]|uniref:dynein light chain 1, cytoplasmic-like isoform X3 n=1 Tax=Populus nigra TaxID=3691 RepID=UPI002B270C95|nr:dynein light chain 1, cytoplasmic-like isoform X3 [Populus nigra]